MLIYKQVSNNERLKLFEVLKELEERKINFKRVLTDIQHYMHIKGYVSFNIRSEAFRKAYNGCEIEYDKELVEKYIKEQIKLIDEQIRMTLNYINDLENTPT